MSKKHKGLGRRLRLIRNDLGLTQKEMAGRYRLGHRALQRYETGKSIPDVDLFTVLSMEGYNLTWLFTGEGAMSKFKRPTGDLHFNLLRQWVLIMLENYTSYKEWFRIELEKRYPEFKEWKSAINHIGGTNNSMVR